MSKLNIEDMYEKVVSACLRCDPISACDRADNHLEPPWEVIDRILRERDEAIEQADTYLARLGETQERMIDAQRERDELLADFAKCHEVIGESVDSDKSELWRYFENPELSAERALADRLAMFADATAHFCSNELIQWNAQKALTAWKEARK